MHQGSPADACTRYGKKFSCVASMRRSICISLCILRIWRIIVNRSTLLLLLYRWIKNRLFMTQILLIDARKNEAWCIEAPLVLFTHSIIWCELNSPERHTSSRRPILFPLYLCISHQLRTIYRFTSLSLWFLVALSYKFAFGCCRFFSVFNFVRADCLFVCK